MAEPAPAAGPASLRLTFDVPEEAAERLMAELWALATRGIEEGRAGPGTLRLEAYFEPPADEPARCEAPGLAARLGARLVATAEIEPRDWLAEYRARAAPFALGRRFWVDPGEPRRRSAAPPGRTLLRIPARTAFGTGSHPSTRLVVEHLEAAPPAGLRVLDLGAGSGILSFVAEALGAGRVVAVERDPAAALTAAENRRLNRSSAALAAGTPACLAGVFDLVLANLDLAALGEVAPELSRLLAGGGRVVASGVLAGERRAAAGQLAAAGLVVTASRVQGGWLALAAARQAAGGGR